MLVILLPNLYGSGGRLAAFGSVHIRQRVQSLKKSWAGVEGVEESPEARAGCPGNVLCARGLEG